MHMIFLSWSPYQMFYQKKQESYHFIYALFVPSNHEQRVVCILRYALIFFPPWGGNPIQFLICNYFLNDVHEGFPNNKKEIRCKWVALFNASFNFKIDTQIAIEVDCGGNILKIEINPYNKLFTDAYYLYCIKEKPPRDFIICLYKIKFQKYHMIFTCLSSTQGFLSQYNLIQNKLEQQKHRLVQTNYTSKHGLEPKLKKFAKFSKIVISMVIGRQWFRSLKSPCQG